MASVPIFILAKDNPRELGLMVKSILHRTDMDFNIIVVDNNSKSASMLTFLDRLESMYPKVVVHRNRTNLWILGLNKPIKLWLGDAKYFVVSDSDIIPPIRHDGDCWLTRLVRELDIHPSIGKLGISLDLGYIKTRPAFVETYAREEQLCRGIRIGSNHVSRVDTTLAIYRRNFFITGFPRFYPGHGVLGEPGYLICRTSRQFKAKHIGWRNYYAHDVPQLDKIICFAKVGAFVDDAYLDRFPVFVRMLFSSMRIFFRGFWFLYVVFLYSVWLVRFFPRRMNVLQRSE